MVEMNTTVYVGCCCWIEFSTPWVLGSKYIENAMTSYISKTGLAIKKIIRSQITANEAVQRNYEDADFAKEQMELMKVQILQQTATAALAQANSAPQSVLSLFR